ncbi:hypothetical protein [Bradyrhizobium macuxiense]|uniref:hypothetical protein n=1 Tax=Bradyrhizobium macuxiense TaxID=1755647 RepID=UPI0010A978AB|nr:hypothetical protein [Bradyrhizobium macuxiense]
MAAAPTKISKTTPCKVAIDHCKRRFGPAGFAMAGQKLGVKEVDDGIGSPMGTTRMPTPIRLKKANGRLHVRLAARPFKSIFLFVSAFDLLQGAGKWTKHWISASGICFLMKPAFSDAATAL